MKPVLWVVLLLSACAAPQARAERPYRAGAAAVDITPEKWPVVVNGMFTERSATRANDRLTARALVLSDGGTTVAIAVVDSCMVPRDVLDRAKAEAARATGIPPERMLVSSTHTHSAPSSMGCLGSGADPGYPAFLAPRIARAIAEAAGKLGPAEVGWAAAQAPGHTYNRRWILRSDKMRSDPFGERTVRAMMHPGYQNPDFIGPSGPVDRELTMLAVRRPDGTPVAVLANYSMHYFGSPLVSADYFGAFNRKLAEAIGAPECVVVMSQGTSGDLMWMDYGSARKSVSMDDYAAGLVRIARAAWEEIDYRDQGSIAMAEAKLRLKRRVAGEKRLAWAREAVAGLQGRKPQSQPEIYAREQVLLAENPEAELKLQALRVGEMGIAALPNEVFAITGLKLKGMSPLSPTMNIELANGAEGYIPPPEQHKLGGYTTWAARTAGLEVEAEPKIVETLLELLEEVAGRPRRPFAEPPSAYAEAVLALRPWAYWRLGEWSGPGAADSSGNGHGATLEGGVALYLEGVGPGNRAPHFAGGWLRAFLPDLGDAWSVSLWFWNGLPADARPISGILVRRSPICVALVKGKLFTPLEDGKAEIPLKAWQHLAVVREGPALRIYLNGALEISGEHAPRGSIDDLLVGAGFEGKIDEVAVWDRALTAEEAARLGSADR